MGGQIIKDTGCRARWSNGFKSRVLAAGRTRLKPLLQHSRRASLATLYLRSTQPAGGLQTPGHCCDPTYLESQHLRPRQVVSGRAVLRRPANPASDHSRSNCSLISLAAPITAASSPSAAGSTLTFLDMNVKEFFFMAFTVSSM